MQAFHLHARRRRAQGAMGAVWLVLAGLTAAFFHTQIVRSPAFGMQSERNRLRPLTRPAARGVILDRSGVVVAKDTATPALAILPSTAEAVQGTLERLAPHLSLTADDIQVLMQRRRRHPQRPLLVTADLGSARETSIDALRREFPEVVIEPRPKRRYPAGAATGHVVGYVGQIRESELRDSMFAGSSPGQRVGRSGIERRYERVLAGEPGVRYIEVDASGRLVGDHAHPQERAPVPGRPLRLNLDLDLQRRLAGLIPPDARGAVAALEPRTGAVLALYSSPPLDPDEFAEPVGEERWRGPDEDAQRRLRDRTIAAVYPPASTWKPATALIALELGIVDPEAAMPMACRGGMRYGDHYFRCWLRTGHGSLDLADALKHSCDVYFYQLGLQVGLRRLLEEGTRLGFGSPTGIDLIGERPGSFPAGTGAYERGTGRAPSDADVLSLAIGQGPNEQTVLKMAQFYAALATDGRAPAPRVAAVVPMRHMPALDLRASPRTLERLREGLRRVVAPGGTAGSAALEHWDWMGKTGTAEDMHGVEHGWFVGIAGTRGGRAELVIGMIVEQRGRGRDVAQYAARAADYYLRKKHGMSIDTIRTLGENTARPAQWAAWE